MLSTSLGCFQRCDLQKQLEKLMGGNHSPGGGSQLPREALALCGLFMFFYSP